MCGIQSLQKSLLLLLMERERETETEHRDTERHSEAQRQTEMDREREREKDRQTGICISYYKPLDPTGRAPIGSTYQEAAMKAQH